MGTSAHIDRFVLDHLPSLASSHDRPDHASADGNAAAVVLDTIDLDGRGGTDQVWFYDMTADGYSLDDKRSKQEGKKIGVAGHLDLGFRVGDPGRT